MNGEIHGAYYKNGGKYFFRGLRNKRNASRRVIHEIEMAERLARSRASKAEKYKNQYGDYDAY